MHACTLVYCYSALVFSVVLVDGMLSVWRHGVFSGVRSPTPNLKEAAMYPIDLFLNFIKSYDKGRVGLLTGKYDWEIKTNGKPKSVWLSEADNGNMAVCQGRGNYFGVTILENSFIIHADVNTTHCELLYQILF